MKDIWKESLDFRKKINKKKIVIAVVVLITILINIAIMIVYSVNNEAHNWIDINIFKKEIMQDKATTQRQKRVPFRTHRSCREMVE